MCSHCAVDYEQDSKELDDEAAFIESEGARAQAEADADAAEAGQRDEPHFHRCPCCMAAMICWCPYPELELRDEMAYCPECRKLGCHGEIA